MKLVEFLDNLNNLVKERPELLELEVISSKDDEGNGFNFVSYEPTVGHIDNDREFKEEQKPNAICIN